MWADGSSKPKENVGEFGIFDAPENGDLLKQLKSECDLATRYPNEPRNKNCGEGTNPLPQLMINSARYLRVFRPTEGRVARAL